MKEKEVEKKEPTLAEKRDGYTRIDGGVTEENIATLRAQHGRLLEIEIYDDMNQEKHIVYVKRPTMDVLSAVDATSKNNNLKAMEIMLENCMLCGSPSVKTDGILRMSAMASLGELFTSCMSKIKNL